MSSDDESGKPGPIASGFKLVKLQKMSSTGIEKATDTAARNIPYRNLLLTGRAVRHRRNKVHYWTAGADPVESTLSCVSNKEARRIAGAMMGELRHARSDDEYNAIIVAFLKDIVTAWPENERRQQHVHLCNQQAPGGPPNPDGTCDGCGFDWKQHEQTKECRCDPVVDPSNDAAGRFEFVVHKQIKREVVEVLQ